MYFLIRDIKQRRSYFFTIIKFPTSPLHIVRRTLLTTVYNGEVGNFVMVNQSS